MTHDQTTPAPVEVTQADVMRSLDRAIDRIMGIEIEAMGGDNLAVTLCSHFDCDDGSEPDDNGWSETATNAYDEIKQEIASLFVPVREAVQAFARFRLAHSAPDGEVEPVLRWYEDKLWLGLCHVATVWLKDGEPRWSILWDGAVISPTLTEARAAAEQAVRDWLARAGLYTHPPAQDVAALEQVADDVHAALWKADKDGAALVEASRKLVNALDSCVDLTPEVIADVRTALAKFGDKP